jgi:transposase
MLAIALSLEGWSRRAAAEACGMDRQTLRDWVHRYNESGLGGLYDRPRRNGPLPSLSAEEQAKVAEWIEQGPDLERDGVVRWRCVDLQQRIKAEFVVRLHERTRERSELGNGFDFSFEIEIDHIRHLYFITTLAAHAVNSPEAACFSQHHCGVNTHLSLTMDGPGRREMRAVERHGDNPGDRAAVLRRYLLGGSRSSFDSSRKCSI